MADGARSLIPLELVDRPVVGQFEQDHVVEVPAVRDVVPAEEAHAELILIALHLLRKNLAHEELEKRVASTANRKKRGQYRHVSGSTFHTARALSHARSAVRVPLRGAGGQVSGSS